MYKYVKYAEFQRISDIFNNLDFLKQRNILVSSDNNYSSHIFDSHELSGFRVSIFMVEKYIFVTQYFRLCQYFQ